MNVGGPPSGESRMPMINPWIQGLVPGVKVYPPLGAWQSRRSLASAPFVPPQWVRESLKGAKAYWYQFPVLTLAAAETQLTSISTSEDFLVLCLMSRASQIIGGGSFRAQIYEDQSAYKWNKQGITRDSIATHAKEPMLLRYLHFIAGGSPVNCRVQNLASVANTVYLTLFGYSGAWRV